jgi:hypothetical protein
MQKEVSAKLQGKANVVHYSLGCTGFSTTFSEADGCPRSGLDVTKGAAAPPPQPVSQKYKFSF